MLQHRHRLARGAGADDHHPGPARRLALARPRGSRPRSSVPVCASNRINTPELAEEILAAGEADLVSMARPLLADPDFVAKAAAGRADEINTCIACNQACLDHVFANQQASCLVNPRACRETDAGAHARPARASSTRRRRRAPGPAGLAAAVVARPSAASRSPCSRRSAELGGQFRLAMAVPGKEEFAETLRYYRRRLEVLGVDVRLAHRGHRRPTSRRTTRWSSPPASCRGCRTSPASTTRSVVSYADVLSGAVVAGQPGRGDRRRRHRRRRQPLPHPRPGRRPRGLDGALGRRRPGPAPGRADRAQAADARRARSPCCSARPPRSASASARPRAGRTARCSSSRGRAGPRRDLRPRRRRRACTSPSTATPRRARRRPRRASAPARSRCAGCTTSWLAAGRPASHLIGGADVAAELDAKRAIEQGTRVAAALSNGAQKT